MKADVRSWVFVYGSLQPGHWNYDRFLGNERPFAVAASARGRLYYAFEGGYPVAVFGGVLPVHGTRLRVNLASEAWLRVWAMEHGAGYELIEVDLDDGTRALTFEWQGRVDPALEIEGGRWRDEK